MKIKALFLGVLVCLICYQAEASERKALIVYRKDVPAYEKIVFELTEGFRGKVGLLPLTAPEEDFLEQLEGFRPGLIIALGDLASYVCRQMDSPKILLFVSNPLIIQHSHQRGDCEIRLFAPPSLILEVVKKTFPKIGKIGLIYTEKSRPYYQEAEEAARRLGISLLARAIGPEEVIEVLPEVIKQSQAFLVIPDPLLLRQAIFEKIVRLGFLYKRPIIGLSRRSVKLGALIAVEYSFDALIPECRKVLREYLKTGRFDCPQIPYRIQINEKTLDFMEIEPKLSPETKVFLDGRNL
ncbi:ABC transporter substrate binding protein [Thermosulfuriphilus sp.]